MENATTVTRAGSNAGDVARRQRLARPARRRSRALLAIGWLQWLSEWIPSRRALSLAKRNLLPALALGLSCWMLPGAVEPKIAAPPKFTNEDCLDCHTDPTNTNFGKVTTAVASAGAMRFFNFVMRVTF